MQADAVAAALAQAHRSEWAFVLSATVRVAGYAGQPAEPVRVDQLGAVAAVDRIATGLQADLRTVGP